MEGKELRRGVWEFMEGDMQVPVRIYATEKILHAMEEGVFRQAVNVSRLPGIQKASLVMPDGHYGYGFPIGGVAAFDLEEGIVSPGGVGYDINCLSGDARILHEHGYTRKIRDFEEDFEKEKIKCMNFGRMVKDTKIHLFLKSRPKKKVFRVKTRCGREITATEDHPFYTRRGMVPLRDIRGDEIAVYPFEGVPYEEPGRDVIVSEEDISGQPSNKDKAQAISELKKRGLLPLNRDNERLPYILKVMGFLFGDGLIYFTGNKGTVWFYGVPEDLESIREDIKKIGFNPSRIYSRFREHRITTEYGEHEFATTEHCFKTTSSSFAALLAALKVPVGNKTVQEYVLPGWMSKCSRWQKRLFLASLFDAELSAPSTITSHGYNFYGPVYSMNKKENSLESGKRFMGGICGLLREFGVRASLLRERKERINNKGDTSYRLRLQVSSKPENLIRFFSTVGFEYSKKKRHLANAAVNYLMLKDNVIKERNMAAVQARKMKEKGITSPVIFQKLESRHVNRRFIERTLYEGRKTYPRVSLSFPTFKVFLQSASRGLGDVGMVWDEIISKKEIEYSGHVYDFGVEDEHHNFVANNFVVSNCGVRLITTDLTKEEVKPRLGELMDNLFRNIPSGVGEKSKLRITESELEEVAVKGAKWAVEKGFGVKDDLKHIEENGRIQGADPSKTSKRARDRGRPQIGTLGAGNHFLEVQEVGEIYDREIAGRFGIKDPGQVTVMVHCGSRGFGHQVADDYIKVMLEASRKYGIKLPDPELACAPLSSREAQDYLSAMYCAVNYAFCNRQVITHWVRETFQKIFPGCRMDLTYDVCHNIAKFEEHVLDGETKKLCVHRKGATRAFAAGRKEIPEAYRDTGQPVLIPGDMGTASYVLVGTKAAMDETFGSTCHGAGRRLSRHGAIRKFRGTDIRKALEARGQVVKATNPKVLAEEASGAYKDINEVVKSVEVSGISKAIAKVLPMGVAKG
ncbi:MAG: intein-containing RctB family protein [Candidatus Altiarchaeota archaeon]|nr:intein-containing RctB family protein [Candidatus Altiarchaeota archaeon]